MFRRLFSTPELKNSGSLARDLLASERTFLAWARTGLGFIALGVALEKVEALAVISPTFLHLTDSRTKVAAGVLVGSGSLCVIHGTQRYFSTMRALEKGVFRPNVLGVMGMGLGCVGIAVVGSAMVWGNAMQQRENEKKAEVVK